MEQNIPDWLTVSFLSQCLQSKKEYAHCKIMSYTAEPALPPGNNYGSNILRVNVNYKIKNGDKEQKLSLIAKFPLTDGSIKELYPQIYESEPLFYNKYLKIGYKLLNYHYAPDNFHSPIDSIIIMEDLKEQGYKMADKVKQLDFEHCRCYMISAAKFHAMSIAVQKQDSQLIESLGKEKFFSNDLPKDQITVGKNNIRYGVEIMAKQVLQDLNDFEISKTLTACSTTLWDHLVETLQSSNELKSFSQGDPWVTNMMFKYNESGKVCDAKLLDFQCLRWGCPADDLVFFIWSSANPQVRDDKTDELYQIYVYTFNKCLKDMELNECLTMVKLKELVLKRSCMALWIAATCLPLIVNSTITDMDPLIEKFKEEYSPEENPFERFYDESYCKNYFPKVIEQLKKAGVFEYLESKLGGNSIRI